MLLKQKEDQVMLNMKGRSVGFYENKFVPKRRRRLQLGGSGGMFPHKILKFRVSEMPSPGFSAGHFQ